MIFRRPRRQRIRGPRPSNARRARPDAEPVSRFREGHARLLRRGRRKRLVAALASKPPATWHSNCATSPPTPPGSSTPPAPSESRATRPSTTRHQAPRHRARHREHRIRYFPKRSRRTQPHRADRRRSLPRADAIRLLDALTPAEPHPSASSMPHRQPLRLPQPPKLPAALSISPSTPSVGRHCCLLISATGFTATAARKRPGRRVHHIAGTRRPRHRPGGP